MVSGREPFAAGRRPIPAAKRRRAGSRRRCPTSTSDWRALSCGAWSPTRSGAGIGLRDRRRAARKRSASPGAGRRRNTFAQHGGRGGRGAVAAAGGGACAAWQSRRWLCSWWCCWPIGRSSCLRRGSPSRRRFSPTRRSTRSEHSDMSRPHEASGRGWRSTASFWHMPWQAIRAATHGRSSAARVRRRFVSGIAAEADRRSLPLLLGQPSEARSLAVEPPVITVRLDGQGRLVQFAAMPDHRQLADAAPGSVNWSVAFELAGLNFKDFQPVGQTPIDGRRRWAWEGQDLEDAARSIRVEGESSCRPGRLLRGRAPVARRGGGNRPRLVGLAFALANALFTLDPQSARHDRRRAVGMAQPATGTRRPPRRAATGALSFSSSG